MSINIVVLGGGTGTFTVLSGLKRLKQTRLSAVVTVADNGGSSGRLRIEHGVLPPGDILQCLVALSEYDEDLRQLFTHRFACGRQNGDTLGNLVLTAAQEKFGDVITATRKIQELLNVHGQVIPVARQATELCAVLQDGSVLVGENEIDRANKTRSMIERCYLEPQVKACYEALEAIRSADLLIFGPGDLYTSMAPVTLASGMREAIASSPAKLFYVTNLMTKRGQTDEFTAADFVHEATQYVGRDFDRVLINNTPLPANIIERYASELEFPVVDDLTSGAEIFRADLLSNCIREPIACDTVARSLIRHDPNKLATAILSAFQEKVTSSLLSASP